MNRTRVVLTGMLLALTGYFLVLPGFWMLLPINASANLPPEWPLGQDLPLQVQVTLWHPNFYIDHVAFSLTSESTHAGQTYPLDRRILYTNETKKTWNRLSVARLTWPRCKRVPVTVPLTDFAASGKIHAGSDITGTLTISTTYVPNVSRYGWDMITQPNETEIPFTLHVK